MMDAEQATYTGAQSREPENGATVVGTMTAKYLPPDDSEAGRVRVSIRLEKAEADDLQLMAQLWNEIDAAAGRKRRHKWLAAGVIEQLIRLGLDGFWEQFGGKPKTAADRKRFIERAIEELKAATK